MNLKRMFGKRFSPEVIDKLEKVLQPIPTGQPFWMVMRITKYNPEAQLSPAVKHVSEAEAVAEAKRLAKAAPGWKFGVFKHCGFYETKEGEEATFK